jgi:choline dehydrogenase
VARDEAHGLNVRRGNILGRGLYSQEERRRWAGALLDLASRSGPQFRAPPGSNGRARGRQDDSIQPPVADFAPWGSRHSAARADRYDSADVAAIVTPMAHMAGFVVLLAPAMLEAAQSLGIPTFDDQNGRMMEGSKGGALFNLRIRNGRRLSVFRTYAYPLMDQPNLTVLTGALVTRVVLEDKRAVGVEFRHDGALRRVAARSETVLSLGAISTPKLLMQSGIGDARELAAAGIEVVQHLPGVGRNFQDHVLVPCVWEYRTPLPPRNSGGEATFFWKSDPSLATPDLQALMAEFPVTTPELARFSPPPSSWSLLAGLVRPGSRGRIRITGPMPTDPVEIVADTLSDPADMKALIHAVEFCREVGNAAAMSPLVKREVMPGNLTGGALEDFVRDGASTIHHQTCTAKMGRDEMSVVDARLRVYGIDNLRIADGSVLPRVTTGNTMAPCVIVGEKAAAFIKGEAGLEAQQEEIHGRPAHQHFA